MNENIDSGAFSPDFDNELNLKKMELEKVKAEEERLTTRIRTLQQNLIDLETKETSRLSSFKSLYSKEKELLINDVESLKREKLELEEKNSELADGVSQNEAKLLKLLSDLSAKTKLVASLDSYLPQLDSSMHEKERNFNRILREIELNDEKLSHLLKRLEHVNREFEIKKLQLDSYESSLLNTQTLLSELEGKVAKYDGLKNEIFRNIKNSIQKENSLKEKISRLEKHLDTLESNRFEIESNLLKAEENYISMAATFKDELNSVKIKHRDISKKLIDKELTLFKKTEEIVRKEKLLTGLEIEFRAIEYRIKVASEEVQSHSARKLKLQEEILQLSGEKIKLENSRDGLLLELEKAGEKSTETEESFVKVLQNFKDEIESLKLARDAAQNEYTLMEERLQILRNDALKSERNFSGTVLENDQLIADRDALTREISKLIELKSKLESSASIEDEIVLEPVEEPGAEVVTQQEEETTKEIERIIPPYGYSGIDKELLSYLSSELEDFGSESIKKELENLTATLQDDSKELDLPEMKLQSPPNADELKDLIKKINENPAEEEEI